RTDGELAQHRRQTIGLIEKIEATRAFPARTGVLCRWCDYQDICDAGKRYLGVETPAQPRPMRSLHKAEQMWLFADQRPADGVVGASSSCAGRGSPRPRD